eukprot:220235-Pelagomonas_calceolata.AAC.5
MKKGLPGANSNLLSQGGCTRTTKILTFGAFFLGKKLVLLRKEVALCLNDDAPARARPAHSIQKSKQWETFPQCRVSRAFVDPQCFISAQGVRSLQDYGVQDLKVRACGQITLVCAIIWRCRSKPRSFKPSSGGADQSHTHLSHHLEVQIKALDACQPGANGKAVHLLDPAPGLCAQGLDNGKDGQGKFKLHSRVVSVTHSAPGPLTQGLDNGEAGQKGVTCITGVVPFKAFVILQLVNNTSLHDTLGSSNDLRIGGIGPSVPARNKRQQPQIQQEILIPHAPSTHVWTCAPSCTSPPPYSSV